MLSWDSAFKGPVYDRFCVGYHLVAVLTFWPCCNRLRIEESPCHGAMILTCSGWRCARSSALVISAGAAPGTVLSALWAAEGEAECSRTVANGRSTAYLGDTRAEEARVYVQDAKPTAGRPRSAANGRSSGDGSTAPAAARPKGHRTAAAMERNRRGARKFRERQSEGASLLPVLTLASDRRGDCSTVTMQQLVKSCKQGKVLD